MPSNKPFAEVIESSLRRWEAQCWQWDVMPTHGSLVVIRQENYTLYGIVHAIQTGSLDGQRTVFPYQKTEDQLKKDHPHIFQLLSTTVSCAILGYEQDATIQYQIAPTPPKIHAFVDYASSHELESFFASERYLHTLFSHADQLETIDDLVLACIQNYRQIIDYDKLMRILHTFSLLTANDYKRLKLFLQRVQPIVAQHQSKQYTLEP